MGGPPDRGEDQEVTVSISGPEKAEKDADVKAYNDTFKEFKAKVKELKDKYQARLKVRVSKITYTKKDSRDSFE